MKIFNSETRVKILALLYGREFCDFNYIREKLNLTSGNLEHHLNILKKADLIEEKKTFYNNRIRTIIKITDKGKEEFKKFLNEIIYLSGEKNVN